MRQPHIETDDLGGINVLQRCRGGLLSVKQQRGVVLAGDGTGQGDAFQSAVNRPVKLGAQRLADALLHLGQRRVVAIGGARGRIDEARHPGILGRHRLPSPVIKPERSGGFGIRCTAWLRSM